MNGESTSRTKPKMVSYLCNSNDSGNIQTNDKFWGIIENKIVFRVEYTCVALKVSEKRFDLKQLRFKKALKYLKPLKCLE